jgi:hypothetical protein
MFIGHYAVGLASKKLAPRASLGVLIAAPILLDLLWPVFLLLGWERVSVEPNSNPFLRLTFDLYPISHGLLAAISWAILFAAIYYGFTRYESGALVIWMAVISHWVLDYLVHRPDLPLYAGNSRLYGLGLWNHRWVVIAIELALFAAGTWIYLRQTKSKDKIGTYGFWGFVVLLLAAYAAAAFGPPPPQSLKKLVIATLCTALLIPLAWWFDSHREAHDGPSK